MIAGFSRRRTKAAFCGLFFMAVFTSTRSVTIGGQPNSTAIPLRGLPVHPYIDQESMPGNRRQHTSDAKFPSQLPVITAKTTVLIKKVSTTELFL
jgi:hypothetical protein